MAIESFIKARLAHLEAATRFNQMNINGIDITQQVRNDVEAIRKIMESLNKLEVLANYIDEGPWMLEHINDMWCAIASRWRSHKDFRQEWLSHG